MNLPLNLRTGSLSITRMTPCPGLLGNLCLVINGARFHSKIFFMIGYNSPLYFFLSHFSASPQNKTLSLMLCLVLFGICLPVCFYHTCINIWLNVIFILKFYKQGVMKFYSYEIYLFQVNTWGGPVILPFLIVLYSIL